MRLLGCFCMFVDVHTEVYAVLSMHSVHAYMHERWFEVVRTYGCAVLCFVRSKPSKGCLVMSSVQGAASFL